VAERGNTSLSSTIPRQLIAWRRSNDQGNLKLCKSPTSLTMPRPLIAVTTSTHENARLYAEGVERSGGQPWVITPEDAPPAQEILRRVGALVVCGGDDIHPRWYGEELRPGSELALNEARDALEIPLVRAALDADLPIYAICRGMQVLNVALGGKVAQGIPGHLQNDENGQAVPTFHQIYISPGSKLAAVVGSGGFVRVNSWHRQGVREAQRSPLLMASAYSLEDGVIEALESPRHRWVIGVQFHPERRLEVPPHFDRLFQSLAERAGERISAMKSP
jgi:putative glutamine amidotransferase